MRRSQIFVAAAVGAALLVAGCTSTTAGEGGDRVLSGTASNTSSLPSAGPSSSAPGGSTSAPASGAPASSGSSSESAGTSAPASDLPSSSAADSSSASGSAALDAQSTKWFDTLCTGFLPLEDLSKLGDTVSSAKDIKTAQKEIVALFTKAGSSFTNTAKSLKSLPAPTVQGGAEVASKVEPVLTELGSELTTGAKKVAAVDVTKYPAQLQTVLTDTATQISSVSSSVSLDNVTTSPGAEKAIAAIPSCKKLSQLGS